MTDVQETVTRRASCDLCRQKKLRCDGGYPECERCLTSGQVCYYSAKRPMGRPKRRKPIDGQETTAPSTEWVEIVPNARSETDKRALDGCFRDAPSLSTDTPSSGCVSEANVDPTLLALETTSELQTCACLANLYLSFEEIRTADELPFARRLSRLRHLIAKAATIIQCTVCPTNFTWAMQNAQLLNALICSLAEEVRKIVMTIEDETHRAKHDEKKHIIINDGETQKHEGSESDGFSVSLDFSEWEMLAKKAVKGAIFGPCSGDSTTFMDMLQMMEERQQLWHSGHVPLLPGIGTRMAHQKDKDPHCVSLVKHTRGIVSELLL